MPNVAQILVSATLVLQNAGLPEPRREASSVLAFALGRDRTFLITHPEYEPAEPESALFESLLERRANREPLQYITGRQEFYGLEFAVAPGVLIPRPETEIVVDEAIAALRGTPKPRFCEVGVGTGCISIAILANIPDAACVGLEISEAALVTAAANVRRHGVGSRTDLRQSDVFSALAAHERFDAIVSNPPYVPDVEIAGLQAEVRDFEPLVALTDGADGLSIIRRIITEAPLFLRPRGILVVEIGYRQSPAVASFVDRSIWSEPQFLTDLQGIPRTLKIELAERAAA